MESTSILDYIGNTPLVEVSRMSPNPRVRIFAKLEGLNPSGSIKDRVARYLVRQAEESGALTPGQKLGEAIIPPLRDGFLEAYRPTAQGP